MEWHSSWNQNEQSFSLRILYYPSHFRTIVSNLDTELSFQRFMIFSSLSAVSQSWVKEESEGHREFSSTIGNMKKQTRSFNNERFIILNGTGKISEFWKCFKKRLNQRKNWHQSYWVEKKIRFLFCDLQNYKNVNGFYAMTKGHHYNAIW